MKIAIFSAATQATRSGNWVTASRWRTLLKQAGHQVHVLHREEQLDRCAAEVLVGLHARKSGKALQRFKKLYPDRSTVVALTGTDLYDELAPQKKRKPAVAVRSLDQCDQIIMLQPRMADRLSCEWRAKASLVMMDVSRVDAPGHRQAATPLQACVVGHLRHEKDPLRAALAVRELPAVQVTHVGEALSHTVARQAERENRRNGNWNWARAVAYSRAQQLMRSSDLLINASKIEGAPNVLFEAIGWRLPVAVSRIDGHRGILGDDYPGYFEVGNTEDLQQLLAKIASEADFYQALLNSIDRVAQKYPPGNEGKALVKAIELSRLSVGS